MKIVCTLEENIRVKALCKANKKLNACNSCPLCTVCNQLFWEIAVPGGVKLIVSPENKGFAVGELEE